MRFLAFLLTLAACAQPPVHRLHTCMAASKGYVVGAKLPPSGLMRFDGGSVWTQLGYNHPNLAGLDYDPRAPGVLYLAAGNGVIAAAGDGKNWHVLTGSDITEIRDVAIDRFTGQMFAAHTAGISASLDRGQTWAPADRGIPRKFTEALAADRAKSGRLVAGTESGVHLTEDAGRTWRLSGAAGYQIMRVAQSPHDPSDWLAVTQLGGLFRSHDAGRTFESAGSVGVNRNLYDIAFDPTTAGRIAVCGWDPGVLVTEDNGKTWKPRNFGLPNSQVWSVAFDPGHPGRLYASVHEEAVYVSEDAGLSWRRAGLEGSVVYRMIFVPEAAR